MITSRLERPGSAVFRERLRQDASTLPSLVSRTEATLTEMDQFGEHRIGGFLRAKGAVTFKESRILPGVMDMDMA
jgi:hypothetical protein